MSNYNNTKTKRNDMNDEFTLNNEAQTVIDNFENFKLKNTHSKFSKEEDEKLMRVIKKHGTCNWVKVATFMPYRNSRQCRERWLNYLSPDLNNSEWTSEEDELLMSKVNEMGKKWVTISKFFPGRTDQMMKNRYYRIQKDASQMAKKKRGRKEGSSKASNKESSCKINESWPQKDDSMDFDEILFDTEELDIKINVIQHENISHEDFDGIVDQMSSISSNNEIEQEIDKEINDWCMGLLEVDWDQFTKA